jgi:hypothetical protein
MSMFETKHILINLLKVYNKSGYENKISGIIKRWLKKHKLNFKEDKEGNLYNFQYNSTPFLNAHLDSVQNEKDRYAGLSLKLENGIISSPGHIIGGDDLCGVYAILYLLKYTNLKFNWVLTTCEESGGLGSKYFADENKQLLKNSLYGLVIDRRGRDDIICSQNDYGSFDFEKKLVKIGTNYGFSTNIGVFSDADTWSQYISCANLSCGYHEPHSTKEYIKLSELFNTINYVRNILINVKEQFPHESRGGYFNHIFNGYYNDDYYDDGYYSRNTYGKSKNYKEDYYLDKYFNSEEENKLVCKNCYSKYKVYKVESLGGMFLCEGCLYDIHAEVEDIIINGEW